MDKMVKDSLSFMMIGLYFEFNSSVVAARDGTVQLKQMNSLLAAFS